MKKAQWLFISVFTLLLGVTAPPLNAKKDKTFPAEGRHYNICVTFNAKPGKLKASKRAKARLKVRLTLRKKHHGKFEYHDRKILLEEYTFKKKNQNHCFKGTIEPHYNIKVDSPKTHRYATYAIRSMQMDIKDGSDCNFDYTRGTRALTIKKNSLHLAHPWKCHVGSHT